MEKENQEEIEKKLNKGKVANNIMPSEFDFDKELSKRISEIDKILSDNSLSEERRSSYLLLKKQMWETHTARTEEPNCPFCQQKLDKPFFKCKFCGWSLELPISRETVDKKLTIRQKYETILSFMKKDNPMNSKLNRYLHEVGSILLNQADIQGKLDRFLRLSESIVKNQEYVNSTIERILDTIIDHLGI